MIRINIIADNFILIGLLVIYLNKGLNKETIKQSVKFTWNRKKKGHAFACP
jgi:hypothetical protein